MVRFSYDQLIQASQEGNSNMMQQIISQLCTQGYLILSYVADLQQILSQMDHNITLLQKDYNYAEMKYSGLGLQVQAPNLIYANNHFPLQNQDLIKKILNIQDEDCPEILKRIELNDQKNLEKSENEFSKMSRQIFSQVLKLVDQARKSDVGNDNALQNQSYTLNEKFDKSEIQKCQSIFQNGDNQNLQRYSSPDFGLGSIIMYDAQQTEEEDKEQNESNLKSKSTGVYVMDSDGKEQKINVKKSEVIITCGDFLNSITNGFVKKPMYTLLTNSEQGRNQIIHQQFLYPNLSFDPSIQEQKQQQAIMSNTSEEQSIKKSNGIARQFLGMCGVKMKMQAGVWIKRIHEQMIAHQAVEYIQTLAKEELYPQIKVLERQFKKQKYPIKCYHYNLIDSTMNVAKQWKKVYVSDEISYAFLADQQFKGQGQNNNTWISPLGNCYVTFLVKYPPFLCYCLSQLTAISVVETLDHYISNDQKHLRPVLKWINDVFVNDKKISGVLCKVEDEYITIGIGVNLNHNPAEILASTSLKQELNLHDNVDVFDFVQKLWTCLSKNLSQVKEWNTFNAIIGKVQGRMQYLNQKVQIFDSTLTKVLQEGIFRGLNEFGNAILEEFNDSSKQQTIIEGRMRPFQ